MVSVPFPPNPIRRKPEPVHLEPVPSTVIEPDRPVVTATSTFVPEATPPLRIWRDDWPVAASTPPKLELVQVEPAPVTVSDTTGLRAASRPRRIADRPP